MSKKVIGSMSEWSGLLKDLYRQIDDCSISLNQLKLFLNHKNPFASTEDKISIQLEKWQNFYKKHFDTAVNLSAMEIPKNKEGFNRLIVVARGMTPQILFDKCSELFSTRKWSDEVLDKIVISERTAVNGPYAIWVRDRVEADKEYKNMSAKELQDKGHIGITLEERLLFELIYFDETGQHLDISNITLCAGSRYGDGSLPRVDWDGGGGRLKVSWYRLDYRNDNLRSRQAVI